MPATDIFRDDGVPPLIQPGTESFCFEEELVLADWLDDNQALATKVFCAANLSMELTLPSIKARANYKSMQEGAGDFVRCL